MTIRCARNGAAKAIIQDRRVGSSTNSFHPSGSIGAKVLSTSSPSTFLARKERNAPSRLDVSFAASMWLNLLPRREFLSFFAKRLTR